MKSIVVLLTLFCQCHCEGTGCPEKWISSGDTDRCYYISDDYASFDVAKERCESKKSQFASVLTHEDQSQLSSILATQLDKCDEYGNCVEFWIGVRDFAGNNKWTTIQGIPVDKQNQFWAQTYPKYSGRRCALMSLEDNRSKGVWKNEYCGRPLRFVCVRTQCPVGFTYISEIDQCLYLNRELKNWDNAREACTGLTRGARMLMIKDSVKQAAVRKYLQQKFTNSAGCVSSGWQEAGNIAWIGGQTKDPNRCDVPYVWKPAGTVETSFSYTNWYINQPSCNLNHENCAVIASSPIYNYRWEDNPCYRGYCSVCEF